MYTEQLNSIRTWAEEDRPRERLCLHGKHQLSNADLLAIILRSGSKENSAVHLAKNILHDFGQDMHKLSKASVDDFIRFKGVGHAKAVSLVAALELGRRIQSKPQNKAIQVKSSQDAFQYLFPIIPDFHVEYFIIVLLNQNNRIIHHQIISQGGINATVVDPKVIFKVCLDKRACSIILSHNHPSGNLKPSEADLRLTSKIKNAGSLLDIAVLDHLIIGDRSYLSFADEGLI